MRATGWVASLCALSVVSSTVPAAAFTLHPAVTIRAANVYFYAGHLVLDASGGATLDDGVVHVSADRILVDLSKNRYVAAGNVRIAAAHAPSVGGQGAALGVDLTSHEGVLVALDPAPESYAVSGSSIAPSPSSPVASTGGEPLALVDLEGETPFARAAVATAHLGADVRLKSTHVIVPGGKDVYIPSYVYTFSSDVGYSQSNVAGSSEDIPIFFGSTRDSVSGAHFTYNSVSKVGVGLDHRIVDGDKAYALFSISPINGSARNANFTWQEQINGHSSQTLSAGLADVSGSRWNYGVTDSVHRSYVNFSAARGRQFDSELLSWQGTYEPLGSGWLGNLFNFHLLSEYGRLGSYTSGGAASYSTSLGAVVQAPYLALNPSSSLSLEADWRQTYYNEPQHQFSAVYTATLQHQWNAHVTTSLTDKEIPAVYFFPSFNDGARTYESQQIGSLYYSNGEPFGFRVDLTHAAASSVPPGISVQPWFVSFDVRFRVSSSLAFDVSRSYGFGYNGSRFGSIGFQIFP